LQNWTVGGTAAQTLTAAISALFPTGEKDLDSIEVARLDRVGSGRRFRRLNHDDIAEFLG